MDTIDNLQGRAKEIRGAFLPESVSNEAVGSLLLDIINFIVNYSGGGEGGGVVNKKYWSKEELQVFDQYLYALGEKVKAIYADEAGNADTWDGAHFLDYLNQAVKRDSDVEFKSVTSKNFESKLLGWILKVSGDAEFRDVLAKIVTMTELTTPDFVSGFLGTGSRLKDSRLELDEITVRKRLNVFMLVIQKLAHQGGMLIISPGGVEITSVVDGGTYYKCSFDTKNGKVTQPFMMDDQLVSQSFDVGNTKRYWRRVTSVGDGYFNLSKGDCEENSDVPAEGDEVVVLGNRTDTSRQKALVLCAVGDDAPYMDTYSGINSYSLEGKLCTREGNLSGIVDDVFGQLEGSGLYANNVYLRGKFALDTGVEVGGKLGQLANDLGLVSGRQDAQEQNLTNLRTEFSVLPGHITQEVSGTIDYKVGEAVASVQFGGRNLLLDSGRELLNGRYWLKTYELPVNLVAGKKYTMVIRGTTTGGQSLYAFMNGGNLGVLRFKPNMTDSLDYGTFTATTPTAPYERILSIYNYPESGYEANPAAIKWAALYEGDIKPPMDWTAAPEDVQKDIDNVQPGTRNLITNRQNIITAGADFPAETTYSSVLNSKGEREVTIISATTNDNDRAYRYVFFDSFLSEKVYPGQYLISFDYKTNNIGSVFSVSWRDPVLKFTTMLENTNGAWKRGYCLCDWGVNVTTQNGNLLSFIVKNDKIGNYVSYRNLKLVRGNRGWDDSEAPEDVQKEIDDVSKALGSLDTTVNGAFKDGIVNKAETDLIKSNINVLEAEKKGIYAGYATLYNNQNLLLGSTAATNLASAWSVYNTAHTNLINSINTAIADGKATAAEKADVDAKFTAYGAALANYEDKAELANRAIQDRIKSLNEQDATKKVETVQDNLYNSVLGETGKMLYRNPEFKTVDESEAWSDGKRKSLVNNITNYSPQNGGGVSSMSRVVKPTDSPTTSTHCLKLTTYGGTSTAHLGGFYFATQSRANAVFLVKVVAKIPVGYTIANIHNSYGVGAKTINLTPVVGTGKFETYLFKVCCGYTGTFSTVNHLRLSGPVAPPATPLEWYVAYATVFDLTQDEGIDNLLAVAKSEVVAGIKNDSYGITLYARQTDFNSLGTRVGAAEATIKTQASNIELKVSKNGVVAAINASPESVKISAGKIDLVGKVAFSMLDPNAQSTINDKITSSQATSIATTQVNTLKNSLGSLAYLSKVEQAQLGTTLIEGGYIKTSLIKTDLILSAGAEIGEFKIGDINGKGGRWLTASNNTMGLSGSQLVFNKGDRSVYVGSHPNEAMGGSPILGYFNIGPITPTLKSTEKCALYAAAPLHSSYLIKSYALYAESGSVVIKNGGFGGAVRSFSLSGTSATIDSNYLVIAINSVQSGMVVYLQPGFKGQIIALLNYSGRSFYIYRNDSYTLATKIPSETSALLYYAGEAWLPIQVGNLYYT